MMAASHIGIVHEKIIFAINTFRLVTYFFRNWKTGLNNMNCYLLSYCLKTFSWKLQMEKHMKKMSKCKVFLLQGWHKLWPDAKATFSSGLFSLTSSTQFNKSYICVHNMWCNEHRVFSSQCYSKYTTFLYGYTWQCL